MSCRSQSEMNFVESEGGFTRSRTLSLRAPCLGACLAMGRVEAPEVVGLDASQRRPVHGPWIRLPGHIRISERLRCTLASMGENEDGREAAVARRENEVYRREAALASRIEVAEEILEAADLRDIEADVRDDTSVKRDRDADLAAFVQTQDADSYGSDNPGRRHAALDRLYARGDRASAADDRHSLAEDPDGNPVEPSQPPPEPM